MNQGRTLSGLHVALGVIAGVARMWNTITGGSIAPLEGVMHFRP
jgi:hypothetical protein